MKRSFILIAGMFFVALTSCQTPEKLSQSLEGAWTTTPEKIDVKGSYEADLIKTFEFIPTEEADGQIIISAMISVNKTVPESDEIVQPITVSCAATATMTGTYKADSYDKVTIKPDPTTLSINVDPQAVNYEYNYLTTDEHPDVTTLKPVLAEQISSELQQPIRENFMADTELTGIRITRGQLKAHLADKSLLLHRQGVE